MVYDRRQSPATAITHWRRRVYLREHQDKVARQTPNGLFYDAANYPNALTLIRPWRKRYFRP